MSKAKMASKSATAAVVEVTQEAATQITHQNQESLTSMLKSHSKISVELALAKKQAKVKKSKKTAGIVQSLKIERTEMRTRIAALLLPTTVIAQPQA